MAKSGISKTLVMSFPSPPLPSKGNPPFVNVPARVAEMVLDTGDRDEVDRGEAVVVIVVGDAPLFVEVGSTTVTDIGGAELTTRELGAAPVPCGSFGFKMVIVPLLDRPSSAAFTFHAGMCVSAHQRTQGRKRTSDTVIVSCRDLRHIYVDHLLRDREVLSQRLVLGCAVSKLLYRFRESDVDLRPRTIGCKTSPAS